MFLIAPVSVSTLVDELLWNGIKFHVESSLHFQCYSKYSRQFCSFHVINAMKSAAFVFIYMAAFSYSSWYSQMWLRWRSRRMCPHLLLQELQNYKSLQNNHQQENVESHTKKIPHFQGKRRSLSKTYPSKVQFSSVTQSCPTLCDPMIRSMPGLPVHHHHLEYTQTHVHQVGDAIHPSHPLSSPLPPAPNPSQHQSLFQWVNSSCEVAKGLEFQL